MKERKAHRGWIPALMLALIAGAAGAPAPASGAPVATPPAPPPRSVEVAATIDLSTTTLDGPGFTATGSTPAYASPGGAVANPNRTLTFTADAHGKTYVLKQTGMRAAPPDPKAPREATSIFSGITFASGIDVTLVARSIDQSAITLPDAATSLTLLLDGPSFVRTHITVPPAATLVIDSLNGDDTADTLTIPSVAGTKNTYASIGGDGTNSGTITIRGGGLDITARSAGAAIGGGGSLSTTIPGSDAGTVAITGGVVTITQFCADGGDLGTGSCGAGIGGGGDPGLDVGVVATGDGGTIAITGGTVGITQYGNAAGIGAGAHGPVGDITIGGAAVTSTVLKKINQAGEGSAIGSSSGTGRGGRGTITITGGTVRATTTDVGAGIGSSNPGKPIHITISGGDVYAASPVGAGIGSMMGVLGDSIAITGGVVVASGGASPGIGNRVAQVAPDFCLSSAAQVTATSGKSPAFVVKANTCDGYYVNAELDKAPSSSAATTLDVHRGALTTSLTLPAASTHFGYGTNSDVPTNDLVVASNGTVTLGTVVRSKDSSTQLYSIHDPAGYAAHQTATGAQANAAVLPVRLTPFASGVVSVSDVGRTTATFHSTGQLSAGTFREGGFRYSTDAAVDAQGALTGAGVVKVPWSGFSASQITAPVVGLDEATTYYVQTYLSTSLGDLYSAVVAFTTRGATVLDLSATTADGAGYTVTGLTPGLDEYATRFPSSDGVVADPAGVVTFGTDGEYALVQSGVLAAPADVASPKNGTSIIGRLVVPDGVNLTLTLRGIDLTGDLVLVGTATVTLLLDADATFAPGATNTVRGSLVVPRDASGVASLVIDDAGGGAGVLTVTATGADAAGIGGDQTGASAGAITIQGGTVTAAGGSGGGAGIGGAAGGSGATLTIGAGAVVTAYATGSSRPALDADGGNHGTGFSANAMIDVPLPGPISVFRDGYAGGRVSDAIEVLALPAGYRAFAYTTGGTSRTDNLYADLGYAAALGRTDHRAIARSADDAKPVFSAQRLDAYDAVNPADAAGTGVLQLTLRRPPTAGVVTAGDVGKTVADLTSTGHDAHGTPVAGGFVYATTLDATGRPDAATAVDLPWDPAAWGPDPITATTGPELVPNTRYQVITYLSATVDLYLDAPPQDVRVESDVIHVVTLPDITAGAVVAGATPDRARVSATFNGGTNPLLVVVYWSADALDIANLPAPGSPGSAVLTPRDYDTTGVPGYTFGGLTSGTTYTVLVVALNETGKDVLVLSYADLFTFAFTKADPAGAPLPGVTFRLDGGDGAIWTARSGDDGRVAFEGLDAGTYRLTETATRPGFQLPVHGWAVTLGQAPVAIAAEGAGSMTPPPAFKPGPDGTLVLPNYPELLPPPLGGVGEGPWLAAGAVLIGAALAGVAIRGRKGARLDQP